MRIVILLIFLSAFSATQAQNFRVPSSDESRAQKWDFSFNILGLESEQANGTNGSGLKIDSETGWGFGIAYNINKRFALGFDMNFVKPGYTATLVDEDDEVTTINHKLTISTGQFKGVWNILQGPLTPYVEGGLGWTYIDSNVASSPPITGCWWDPFWGYICNTFFNTYSDTSFSYSGGLGVRWEITPQIFLRGGYNYLKVDLGSSAGDLKLGSWLFSVGTSY